MGSCIKYCLLPFLSNFSENTFCFNIICVHATSLCYVSWIQRTHSRSTVGHRQARQSSPSALSEVIVSICHLCRTQDGQKTFSLIKTINITSSVINVSNYEVISKLSYLFLNCFLFNKGLRVRDFAQFKPQKHSCRWLVPLSQSCKWFWFVRFFMTIEANKGLQHNVVTDH